MHRGVPDGMSPIWNTPSYRDTLRSGLDLLARTIGKEFEARRVILVSMTLLIDFHYSSFLLATA